MWHVMIFIARRHWYSNVGPLVSSGMFVVSTRLAILPKPLDACLTIPIVIVSSAYSIIDKHWTLCFPKASYSSADRLQPIIVKYK